VGFPACLDPEHPPFYFPPTLANCTAAPRRVVAENFADGVCHHAGMPLTLNTANCGWDGGDCCSQTCRGREAGQCGSPAADGADAEDIAEEADSPAFVCREPAVLDVLSNGGACDASRLSWVGDGYCDAGDFNTANCGWDGGDWCVPASTSALLQFALLACCAPSLLCALGHARHEIARAVVLARRGATSDPALHFCSLGCRKITVEKSLALLCILCVRVSVAYAAT
jgi:hypothetical protein